MKAPEETRRLLLLAKRGDAAARERLVRENMPLVRSVVKRFAGRGADYEDLMQLGSMGLLKAVDHFDLGFSVRFSTYAVPMIAGEIRRFLRDDGAIKVSRSLKELLRRVMAAREALYAETGREAGVIEIAARVDASPEDVAAALDASRPVCSLSEPVTEDGEDGASRGDTLKSPVSESAWVDRLLVKDMLGTLSARERQIIVLRYFRDMTQARVAELIGVSQVQVSRLESRILARLRAEAGAQPRSAPE